jgi:small subunit ribosomal protein S1
MSKKDLFGDELTSTGEMDFETMLNQSMVVARRRVGDVFIGEILSIGKEEAFVSTGTPTDGAVPVAELLDENKKLAFKVGDKIEVRVLRVRESEIFLRREDAKSGAAEVDSLEDAFDMELPVEGRVLEVIKGGYRVSIGNVKAFCPVSQMDLRPGADAASHVGQKYEFIITQYDSKARNIVVSRRKWLEQQKAESEGEFLTKAKPGDLHSGTITRLEKFGAFVAIDGGLEGLIPISELAWGRVASPADVVSLGQKVQVLLLKAEEQDGRLRLSFSLKQAGGEGDPWMKVTQMFPVGTIVSGTVEKKEAFGLFINLAPGISGLMPRSKWRDHVDGQAFENKKKGDVLQVMVDQIQFEEKKLTLAPPGDRDDSDWKAHAATSSSSKGLGTLGDLLKNAKVSK